jgi:hypothetical protein
MFTHLILRAVKGDRGREEILLEEGKTYTLGRARDGRGWGADHLLLHFSG